MFTNKKTFEKGTCPMLGEKCIEEKCRWWVTILGKNPQTGQDMNSSGCSVEFLPILLIENSQQQRQTAAAVESTRNEQTDGLQKLAQALLLAQAKPPVLRHDEKVINPISED